MTTRCQLGAVVVLWILVSGTVFGFYSPQQGRWLSREPLGEGASINVYAYCLNSPLSFVDPDGSYAFGLGPNLGGGAGQDYSWDSVPYTLSGVNSITAGPTSVQRHYGMYDLPIDVAAAIAAVVLVRAGLSPFDDLTDDQCEKEDSPFGELTRTGEEKAGPSTRSGNRGGTSLQEEFIDKEGNPITKHTVFDKNGKPIHGPHYRPGPFK